MEGESERWKKIDYVSVGQAEERAAATWGHGSRGSPDRASHSSGREAEEVEAQFFSHRTPQYIIAHILSDITSLTTQLHTSQTKL